MTGFEGQIRRVQEEIDDVRRRQQEKENEVEDDIEDENDGGLDLHNSTYTEEVWH